MTNFNYVELINQFGLGNSKSLGWSSKATQNLRFDILIEYAPSDMKSILDVGSGYGDLYAYLKAKEWNVQYMGLEPFDIFYSLAVNKFGKEFFTRADVEHFKSETKYDYVIGSGLFWIKTKHPEHDFLNKITKMFALCKKATAFNMLHIGGKKRGTSRNYMNPVRILSLVADLTKKSLLIEGYHPENKDFTIILYK